LKEGIIVVDSDNRIIEANPAFCKILGLQPRQVIGENSDVVLAKINVDISSFLIDNDFPNEIRIEADGDFNYFEIKCHLIFDKKQNSIGKILQITDITTKKMILDALAESNTRKEADIIEKEKLITDLDAYARSVAHDLKNPIASVVGLSDLTMTSLKNNNLNEAIEMLSLIQNQSEKMVRIIEDLLLLSRIRKEKIELVPIDIQKILNEVFVRLHNEIVSRGATFKMPDIWPEVLGHEQWIEEVWINLISNALKYGGNPPLIKLGFEKMTESTFRMWIQDNGNGINPESHTRIFEDFERLGRKDNQGHGLGLSIVKRIILKLNGEINVACSGKPGDGCVFSFTLKKADPNLM